MLRGRVAWCAFVQVLAGSLHAEAWSPRPPLHEVKTPDGKMHKSLYPKDGPVEVLTGKEFKAEFEKDKNVIWLVEYYDITCPHCWVFSSVYPRIAKAIASGKVRVGAMNCMDYDNLGLCQLAGVFKYPTLMVYNAKKVGTHAHVHVHGKDDPMDPLPPKTIVDWLSHYSEGKIKILHPGLLASGAFAKGSEKSLVKPDGPPGKPGWSREAYGSVQTRFHDAHLGFVQLLSTGYVTKGKYKAALKVLDFVARAFSNERQPDESKYFAELQKQFKAKPDMEPLEVKKLMDSWSTRFNKNYMFCETPTCTVWQLLHGIAALVVIKYTPITAAEALPMFRFMIDEFLSCNDCRVHFVESYDKCLFGRCEVLTAGDEAAQAKALLLWLWRTHNAVSVRVISEPPLPLHPVDRRYPNYKDCPGCWKTSVAVMGKPGKVLQFAGQTDTSGKLGSSYDDFEEEKVFGFLLVTYLGADDDETQVKAAFGDIAKEFLHRGSAPYSLITMCLAVSALVAAVSVIFAARRYRRGTKESCRRAMVLPVEEEFLDGAEIVE